MKRRYRNMTPAKARRIRHLYFEKGLRQWEIGKMFGITQHSVSRIVSGKSWADA